LLVFSLATSAANTVVEENAMPHNIAQDRTARGLRGAFSTGLNLFKTHVCADCLRNFLVEMVLAFITEGIPMHSD